MSHIVTGRLDVGTRCQTETTASLGASHLSGGVGGWQAPKSLATLVSFKPWKEDHSDIDDDGGLLYDRVKMLYVEGYEPKPVLTEGTEYALSIVSNLSPTCLQHEFLLPPQQLCPIANMTSLPDSSFSEHEGPPPPGGESSNPGSYPS